MLVVASCIAFYCDPECYCGIGLSENGRDSCCERINGAWQRNAPIVAKKLVQKLKPPLTCVVVSRVLTITVTSIIIIIMMKTTSGMRWGCKSTASGSRHHRLSCPTRCTSCGYLCFDRFSMSGNVWMISLSDLHAQDQALLTDCVSMRWTWLWTW